MREATEFEKQIATDVARTALSFDLKDQELRNFLVQESMGRSGSTIIVTLHAYKLVRDADQWYNGGEK